VKELHVRNLTEEFTVPVLRECFRKYGPLERVKKIKDYAFVQFKWRPDAILAMETLNGRNLYGVTLELALAKPPSDKKKKDILMARERFSPEHCTSGSGSTLPPTHDLGQTHPIRSEKTVSQPASSSSRSNNGGDNQEFSVRGGRVSVSIRILLPS
jgi:RNA recognition motif-containing protein